MQALYFTLIGIVLYLGSDWVLRMIERRRGRILDNRSLVFFCILLPSALIVFAAVRHLSA